MSTTPFELIVIVTASTQDKFREMLPRYGTYVSRLQGTTVHRVGIRTENSKLITYTYTYATLIKCIKDILYEYPNIPRLTVNQFEREIINHVHVT